MEDINDNEPSHPTQSCSSIYLRHDGIYVDEKVIFATPESASDYLKPYHRQRIRPGCGCCDGDVMPELVVTYSKTKGYKVRIKAKTQEAHAPECRRRSQRPKQQPRGSTNNKAIEEFGTEIQIQLSAPIGIIDRLVIPGRQIPYRQAKVGRSRNQTTLGGLTSAIWKNQNLHMWDGVNATRYYDDVRSAIYACSETVRIGCRRLNNVLYIPDSIAPDDSERFWAMLRENSQTRVVLMGQLKYCDKDSAGCSMRIKFLDGIDLHMHKSCYARLQRGQSHGNCKVWVTATCRIQDKQVVVDDFSVMPVNRVFIPIDSSYELKAINTLVDAGRKFTKPIDCLIFGEVTVKPDVVLHDADGGDFYMEIWGMSHAKYRARKKAKTLLYHQLGLQLWQWDAADLKGKQMPELPRACHETTTTR